MFEQRTEPLLSRRAFLLREARFGAVALSLILGSLIAGILGYHYFESLSWIDALVNASMILGGMGPVNELKTTAGKLFASFYALYSGIIFLVIAGLFFAPILHRILHSFHLDPNDDDQDASKTK